jgi:hypothetical protein
MDGLDPIILGLAGVVIILVLSLILVFVLYFRRRRGKTDPAHDTLDVAQRLAESVQLDEHELTQHEIGTAPLKASASPRSKILAEVGARSLLDQVNSHVLQGRGQISSKSGEIRMEWTDLEDATVQRGIMIRVQDPKTLLINGMAFPATREGAQQGLISCLKGMKLE